MGKLIVPYTLRDDLSVIDLGKPGTPVLNYTGGLQRGQKILERSVSVMNKSVSTMQHNTSFLLSREGGQGYWAGVG